MVKNIYINKDTLRRLAGNINAQKAEIIDRLGFEVFILDKDVLTRLIWKSDSGEEVIFTCKVEDL